MTCKEAAVEREQEGADAPKKRVRARHVARKREQEKAEMRHKETVFAETWASRFMYLEILMIVLAISYLVLKD